MANYSYPKLVVLCTNSAGAPEFHTCSPEVTQEQLDNGDHYEMAKENAEHHGFTGPMIAFDETDPATKQLGYLVAWMSPKSGSAVEVLSGHFGYEGTELRVDFQVPLGATAAEKDAAFLGALAQQADVNYLAIGESDVPLPESETADSLEARLGFEYSEWPRSEWQQEVANGDTKLGYWMWVIHIIESRQDAESRQAEKDSDPDQLDRIADERTAVRSIFTEALAAKFISTSASPKEDLRIRRDLVAQELLLHYPAHMVITRELYDADDHFGECLIWLDAHFELPNWERRTVGEFFKKHGIPGEALDMIVIQQNAQHCTKGGIKSGDISIENLWDALALGENGWLLTSGLEIWFHES